VLERFFKMNLRRGFRRVFTVVWVLSVAALLFYPFYVAQVEMHERIGYAVARYGPCMQDRHENYPGNSWEDNYKFCEAEQKELTKDLGFWMGWLNLWRTLGWHVFWFVPGVVLIPPLIVYGMLYGVIWLLVKTSRWVAQGFRESRT